MNHCAFFRTSINCLHPHLLLNLDENCYRLCYSWYLLIVVNSYLVVFASALDCATNQNYVKILKVSISYAAEELFVVYDGSTPVIESITLTNNEAQTFEYCIAKRSNSQYTLEMKDSYGDSWTTGSYIEIRGKYDNLFFKNMMTEDEEEEYTLSLYYAIAKNAAWKITNSFSANWKDFSFDDSAWSAVAFTPTAVTGTQYLR